jgi:hypothetical protein
MDERRTQQDWDSRRTGDRITSTRRHAAKSADDCGVAKDVTFVEESDANINDQIDAAYRTKYRRYAASIIDSVVSREARSATIKLAPK